MHANTLDRRDPGADDSADEPKKAVKATAAAKATSATDYDAVALVAEIKKAFDASSEQLKKELKHVADERRYLADERERLQAQHRVLVGALEKEAARLVLKVQETLGEIVPTSYQTVSALQTLRTVVTKVTPKIVFIQIATPAVIATAVSTVVFVFAPIVAELIK